MSLLYRWPDIEMPRQTSLVLTSACRKQKVESRVALFQNRKPCRTSPCSSVTVTQRQGRESQTSQGSCEKSSSYQSAIELEYCSSPVRSTLATSDSKGYLQLSRLVDAGEREIPDLAFAEIDRVQQPLRLRVVVG